MTTCQWETFGEYECDNEAIDTVEAFGEEIDLCQTHKLKYESTQL